MRWRGCAGEPSIIPPDAGSAGLKPRLTLEPAALSHAAELVVLEDSSLRSE